MVQQSSKIEPFVYTLKTYESPRVIQLHPFNTLDCMYRNSRTYRSLNNIRGQVLLVWETKTPLTTSVSTNTHLVHIFLQTLHLQLNILNMKDYPKQYLWDVKSKPLHQNKSSKLWMGRHVWHDCTLGNCIPQPLFPSNNSSKLCLLDTEFSMNLKMKGTRLGLRVT